MGRRPRPTRGGSRLRARQACRVQGRPAASSATDRHWTRAGRLPPPRGGHGLRGRAAGRPASALHRGHGRHSSSQREWAGHRGRNRTRTRAARGARPTKGRDAAAKRHQYSSGTPDSVSGPPLCTKPATPRVWQGSAGGTGPARVPAKSQGRIARPSSSAALASRWSRQAKARVPASCSLTSSAAPSCPASAARRAWRPSNVVALDRTASASVTASQLPAKACSRASTCRRWLRVSRRCRTLRSMALTIFVRDRTEVTI